MGQEVRCGLSAKRKAAAVIIILAVAIIAGILLWRAYTAKQAVTQTRDIFSGAFEAEVTIKSGETSLTAVLGRDETGSITLTVKDPSPLAGVALKQQGGQLTASYGNMEVPLNLQGFPSESAVKPLFSLLSGAADMIGANVKEEDGQLVLSGTCDAGPYTVTLDRESGMILRVDFPDVGFTCDFDRFLSGEADAN